MNRFRKKRFELFFKTLGIDKHTHILDAGGHPKNWRELGFLGRVTCVSLRESIKEGFYGNGNIEYKLMDVSSLPYADKSFEVVYSNSLLEHVGQKNQMKAVNEIKRVGKKIWVQVPYRHFPIEPHFIFPFFYYYPLFMRKLIAEYWTPIFKKKNPYLSEVETIWLPDKKEFKKLFHAETVISERFLGFTKSLIAYRS